MQFTKLCNLFISISYLFSLSLATIHIDDTTAEIQSCLSPDLENHERERCRFFAAVIDAGSTGTRLHLFEFSHKIGRKHSAFKLESELYKEVKPGLSFYVKEPGLAVKSIEELLQYARNSVPVHMWQHTPITLKATAGLRLLEEDDSNEIIFWVEKCVATSGFLVGDNSVGILSGVDEGVFGWFTLNYLLGRFETNINKTKVVALDLGGGSTQITFIPVNLSKALINVVPKDFTHRLNLFGNDVVFYTHSYLGNGLIAARHGVAKLTTEIKYSETNIKNGDNFLVLHCFSENYVLKDWDYGGKIWIVSSTNSEANFVNCLLSVRQYVENTTKVAHIAGLEDYDIFAFSYFYDRAIQADLFKTLPEINRITVGDYKHAAEKACALKANKIGLEHYKPWQCFDLVYIYALLRYGYNLCDDKALNLIKKSKNKEVSWALGAGFHLLNTYHEKKRLEVKKMKCLSNSFSSLSERNIEHKKKTCPMTHWYLQGNQLPCNSLFDNIFT